MNDHSSAAQAAGASITALSIALVGVPYLALLWGFIGAAVALVLTGPETPKGAMLSVLAAGLVGAAGGQAAAEYITGQAQTAGSVLIVASLLIGAGAKPILGAAVAAVIATIGRLGGQK